MTLPDHDRVEWRVFAIRDAVYNPGLEPALPIEQRTARGSLQLCSLAVAREWKISNAHDTRENKRGE